MLCLSPERLCNIISMLEDYEQIAVTVKRDSADTCRHLHNQYGGSTEYCTWAGADIIDKNTDGKSMNVDLADLPSTRTIIASDDIIALSDNVENAEFEISCWWCSVESIEGTVARKPADSHTHTADNIWQKNENSHWHNCTDKDCTEKLDYAEHISSGEATVSTAESCTV